MTTVNEGVFLMDDEENQSQKELLLDDNNLKDDDERGEDDSQYQKITSWPRTFRDSMEAYGSVPHSSVVLEAGSRSLSRSLTRLNNSFRSLSLRKRGSSHHLESTLTAPLLYPDQETADKPSLAPRSASRLSFTSSAVQPSFHEPIKGPPKCSYAQSVFNGINVMCGVGLLSTPYAIKQGGWLGLLILFAFSFIACFTGVLLKRCLESNPALHTFPDIAQAAFGTPGRLVISILLYAELYAACVEFIILMGDNLSSVFPDVHVNLVGVYLNSHQLFSILATVAVLPTAWLRNLSFMSYLSAGGVIASVLVVLCLLWVGVIDGVGFHPSGTALDIANLPVALGLYGFCYAGHPLFPNIYLSMQNPADFPSVMLLSFIICTVLYSGVAITGFLMFGEAIESQFTLNMPTTFVASKIAVWTTVVNPLTKYALTITPVALSLEELLPLAWFKSHLVSILIRTTLVLSTLLVAITFPFFGFIMALIGSFITMIIALIFPCASYLKLMRGKLSRTQIAVSCSIMTVGIFCSMVGTYSSVMKIANTMQS